MQGIQGTFMGIFIALIAIDFATATVSTQYLIINNILNFQSFI